MAESTKIEWTDATWNPIVAERLDTRKVGFHCEKISPACAHCYAESFNGRGLPARGTQLPYTRASRDLTRIVIAQAMLQQPIRWRKPRRVFVCSMTDIFGEFVPFELIDQVFAVMALAHQHTFQVLTKRPARMAEYFDARKQEGGIGRDAYVEGEAQKLWHRRTGEDPSLWLAVHFPLPNVHLGVTVEDQQRADERIPWLLKCPAALRFLSCEPLLGPVDLTRWLHQLGWVIVGAESGHNARPCDVAWIRSIVAQCKAAGVPCFVKQLGARPVERYPSAWPNGYPHGEQSVVLSGNGFGEFSVTGLRDKKGGDPAEWPVDLRVREFPEVRA